MNNPNQHLFKYCPNCGSQEIRKASVKSVACQNCEFKLYINAAAAGMAVIFDDESKVLVTRRKYNPAKGTLDFPGGFAEPGETIENCIKREIKEELNLDVTHARYLFSTPNQYFYQKVMYPIVDMVFICQVKDLSCITANDDISEYLFIPVSELDPDRFGHQSPKEVIAKLKQIYQKETDPVIP